MFGNTKEKDAQKDEYLDTTQWTTVAAFQIAMLINRNRGSL